ncbi:MULTISPECIES: hypothetical protein [unclassified Alsobacter]|uniref:Uncharacterized protein n=1 Tax=Alsobacter sp. KACC 23698 TaxID=3149229 RepID=A0AAU7JDJ1_9HYPH
MSKRHPSGRPLGKRKIGVSTHVRWPREGFVNSRLGQTPDLAGGFGFRMPEATHEHLHHVALARRNAHGKD